MRGPPTALPIAAPCKWRGTASLELQLPTVHCADRCRSTVAVAVADAAVSNLFATIDAEAVGRRPRSGVQVVGALRRPASPPENTFRKGGPRRLSRI